MTRRLLVITGGHRFDAEAFATMLDAIGNDRGWEWAHAEQPSAQRWLRPEHAGVWDAILLYDIPGLSLARGREPASDGPSPRVQADVHALLDAGQGLVVMHHALAGWPAWDGWADIIGGRFLYSAGTLHGAPVPASGYRMDTYAIEVVDPEHPVCSGIEPFAVADELYLCPVGASVKPLFRTTADTSPTTMIDTHHEVVHGEQRPAPQQPGSPLVGWTNEVGASRIVTLLPGHGPATMAHPMFRRVLGNAIEFVAP